MFGIVITAFIAVGLFAVLIILIIQVARNNPKDEE